MSSVCCPARLCVRRPLVFAKDVAQISFFFFVLVTILRFSCARGSTGLKSEDEELGSFCQLFTYAPNAFSSRFEDYY